MLTLKCWSLYWLVSTYESLKRAFNLIDMVKLIKLIQILKKTMFFQISMDVKKTETRPFSSSSSSSGFLWRLANKQNGAFPPPTELECGSLME